MTNGWVDIKNTDMMLVMGGNPPKINDVDLSGDRSEAGSQRKADRGGPRFTRTATISLTQLSS
jgi:hypothetical protein